MWYMQMTDVWRMKNDAKFDAEVKFDKEEQEIKHTLVARMSVIQMK